MIVSLPLTEKKKESKAGEVFQKEKAEQVQKVPEGEVRLDAAFYRQRDLLQRELSEHKNRIKKLQADITAAMKMFEDSESQAQNNKNRLV